MGCGCRDCEQMMQPYMDRTLSDDQIAEAKEHLERCPPCEKRYRFEEKLRVFVRIAVEEPMPETLKTRLADMRTTL